MRKKKKKKTAGRVTEAPDFKISVWIRKDLVINKD